MAISNVRIICQITSTPAFPGGSITVDAATEAAAEVKLRQEAENRLAAQQGNAAVLEEFLSGF